MEEKNCQYTEQLKKGEKEAYVWLFKKYYRILIMYALRIVKKMEFAEEVVQNVFSKIWERHEQIDFSDNIEGYLYRSVHNESINHLRAEERHSALNVPMGESPEPYEEFTDLLHQTEMISKLELAIKNLPNKTKQVFVLSRYELLSYKAISERLEISVKGVEFHMVKALKQLRSELNDFFEK